jgi:DNA-binding SARP family transcriptional activator/DNA-binding NarL/FixJ family response regulator
MPGDDDRGMANLEFRLLGRVEVGRDGRPVDIGGPKHRAVLASLLLRPRRVVSLEQLIDDLWPEHPPARAAATVQVFVSQLRRALEPDRTRGAAATVLVTASPGYRLDVEPEAVDAHTFSQLVTHGRQVFEDGDPKGAAQLLRRAEDMWRGPVLADVPATPFVQAAAAGLTELHLGATEDRIEAELALGRQAALVAELDQLVHRHPLRERLREQLMLALYRCGRQVEALTVFRATRQVLHEELGLEPGARLRALEQAILRQDPALSGPSSGQPARSAPKTEGKGRVLIVDDTAINRTLLATAVTNLGHEVQTAPDGHRALELLREAASGPHGFDVVLLDLLMPVLDGYATLAQIKADPALSSVPVIMVSAVPELESVVRCIELGAVDYLPKPYSSAMLKARLHASLQARRSATERETALRNEIAQLRSQVALKGR